jgi:hypothetical protein
MRDRETSELWATLPITWTANPQASGMLQRMGEARFIGMGKKFPEATKIATCLPLID